MTGRMKPRSGRTKPGKESVPDNPALLMYLRFHNPSELIGSEDSREQLSEWAARIRAWLADGRRVYAYFNNDLHGYAISNARLLAGLLTGSGIV